MAAVNIRRDVKDAFYRYKMPVLLAKIEGKGNGIKTVIINMADIGKSLNRPPSYSTKYFGCELGAQVICDEKTNRYIVNGAHEGHRLQELLDGFITKFVLCPSCKNPETDLVIAKDTTIYTKCKACGEKKPIDQRHKLVTFILKNAPPRKKKSAAAETPSTEKGSSGDEHLAQKMIHETAENTREAHDSDDEWAMDMSAEAVARRKRDQVDRVTHSLKSNLALGDDEEEDDEAGNPLEAFAEFLKSDPPQAEVLAKIDELKIRPYKAVAVYMQVTFSDNIMEVLPSKLDLLRKMCVNEKCQKGVMGGIERLVAIVHKDLQKKLPLILQALYQADVLEEEVLLYWADHPSKKYVDDRAISKSLRVSAAPFIEWLKNAAESSTEEEDEECDDDEDDGAEEENEEEDDDEENEQSKH